MPGKAGISESPSAKAWAVRARQLSLRYMVDPLLQILWPETALCRGCGAVSDAGCLCSACRTRLREDGAAFAWAFRRLGNNVPAYSLRPHAGLPRQLVLRLKYHAEACIAPELAALVQPLPSFFSLPEDTVVTWVPMPAHRLRERCVDHGRLLAQAVAQQLGLPCRPLLCRRQNHARSQAALKKASRRRANLQNTFIPVERITFHVLLVDDVLTTGTTATRCAEALHLGGAVAVTVLTMTCSTVGQGF